MTDHRPRPLKVGLHLPETERVVPWSEIADMCRLAEDVGFESLWVPDHLLYEFDGVRSGPWECWSVLSAVAALTTRVEIGPLVLCANFRNPALVAKMADTVDEISNGRLILGLGAGWHQPEYDAFGYPYAERFARFSEAFTIIRTLLRDGEVDFAGRYYTVRDCELRPRGPRRTGPPLMIGSQGDRVLAHALPHVDYWNGWFRWSGNTVAGTAPLVEQVDRICAEVGRDPRAVQRTIAVLVAFDDRIQPHNPENPALIGPPELIAETLLGYARAGFSHIQVMLDPITVESIERFAPVLELIDRHA